MRTLGNIALCIIALITHNAISFAQINLVSNPSFELITSCPSGFYQIDSASGWSTPKNGGGKILNFLIHVVPIPIHVVCL